MALSAEQLYQVRIWIPWPSVTDTDLNTRYDALGESSYWPLVREQLRRQLQLALVTPAQFTIVGEYGQNTTENIDGIRKALAQVEAEVAAESGQLGFGTSTLVRPYPYRAGRTRPRPAGPPIGSELIV
jgi:hypothetical protein